MIRVLWLIPITFVVVGAGLALRARRRRQSPTAFSLEHVSGDWLAQARGREEQEW
jgi:cytochrome c-type biogenesis protein CcmH/NrfF